MDRTAGQPPASRDDFMVALICALPVEFEAVKACFDHNWEEGYSYGKARSDPNLYATGRIGIHNVVAVLLAGMGKVNATRAATALSLSFANIRLGLVVGICGAVPFYDHNNTEIILGDVIISTGIVQHDLLKQYPDRTVRKATTADNLGRPKPEILSFLASISGQTSKQNLQTRVQHHLDQLADKAVQGSRYPGVHNDRLYKPDYRHKHQRLDTCDICVSCKSDDDAVCEESLTSNCTTLGCEDNMLMQRLRLGSSSHFDEAGSSKSLVAPDIHFGIIASGDTVMKSGKHRDHLAEIEGVIGFEMEGAGVWEEIPTVIVKGVCDYADSHKNDIWHNYAAVTAAVCTKSLLELWRIVDDLPVRTVTSSDIRTPEMSESQQKTLQTFRTSQYETYKNRNADAMSQTCQWALGSNVYSNWSDGITNSLLWISAEPGCGKSVLAKHVVDIESKSRNWFACYFFFRRGADKAQASVTSALCAIIHQIVSQHPRMVPHIQTKLVSNGESLLNNFEKLWSILLELLNEKGLGQIVIVLDGMDECDDDEHHSSLIQSLRKYSEHTGKSDNDNLRAKFLVTSRPYVSLERKLRGMERHQPGTWLQGDLAMIQADIDIVIISKVDELATELDLTQDVSDMVLKELKAVVNRTYLWLTIVLEDLRTIARKSKKKLLERLKILPADAEEAYEDLLSRVTDREEARTLFNLVLVAQPPLSVTEAEIALAMNENPVSHDDIDYESGTSFKEYIKHTCGLFLAVFDDHLYFFHESARDFLLSANADKPQTEEGTSKRNWRGSFSANEANRSLAMICCSYLSLDNFSQKPLLLRLSDKYLDRSQFREPSYFPYEPYDYCFKEMATLYKCGVYIQDSLFLGEVQPIEGSPTIEASTGRNNASQASGDGDGLSQEAMNIAFYEESEIAVNAALVAFPFLEYAATNWHIYAAKVAEIDESLERMLLTVYDDRSPIFSNWFSVYWSRRPVHQTPHFKPLSLALRFGHWKILRTLIDRGADVNGFDVDREPIHTAAIMGLQEETKLLLDRGARINDVNFFNRTALHLACYYNQIEVVKVLLERDADVNARDKFGYNCAHILAQRFHPQIFELIVQYKINLHQTDRVGLTPLWRGLYDDQADFIGALLKAGVVPTERDWQRAHFEGATESLTHFENKKEEEEVKTKAALHPAIRLVENDDLQLFLQKLQTGNLLNSVDWVGNSALHEASERDAVSVLKYCIEKKLDPNFVNLRKVTPLHIATSQSHHEAMKILLNAGANANAMTSTGVTPFFYTASNGDEEGANLLLTRGANLEARNNLDQTPLLYALLHNQLDMADFLLDKGADAAAEDALGGSPLLLAVVYGKQDLTQRLLRKGAKVSVRSLENDLTPFDVAVLRGDTGMAQLLIEYGADINIRGKNERRPIHRAIQSQNFDMVKWLVSHGADYKTPDEAGLTVLHWAAFGTKNADDLEIIRFFLEKGIDPHARNVKDQTALDLAKAAEGDDYGIAELLEWYMEVD